MNFVKIKLNEAKEYLQSIGLTETTQKDNDTLQSFRLNTPKGQMMIAGGPYGDSLLFLIPQVDKKKVWKVAGSIGPVPFEKIFEGDNAHGMADDYMEQVKRECNALPLTIGMEEIEIETKG